MRLAGGVVALALACTSLAACDSSSPRADPSPVSASASASRAIEPVGGAATLATDDPSLDAAVSEPVEDRVYPSVGDPSVDALHYDLDLAWTPSSDTLTAVETLVFRATATGDHVQLDLGQALTVSSVTVDGADADFDHPGKDLVVHLDTRADRRYTMVISYAGSPRPVSAPTTRGDFSTLGWTTTTDHAAWTMQEPYGAYSWYAVNDQPADKALYSFTIAAPEPMMGVANGTLDSRDMQDGTSITRWHLDEPASSYLVTIAIGDFQETKDRSTSGVPITYWTPRGAAYTIKGLRSTAPAVDWVEGKLGPYPFSSLGILLVDSRSGMETQSMITLGRTDYTTAPQVLVHEIVHQWYGDEITPRDWRDVWMSEGMALYLQGLWEAEHDHRSVESLMAEWGSIEPQMRRESGPPADYDPATFGEGNIYYGPALMWDELRKRLGDDEFWRLVREWPTVHEDGNAGYDDITSWWSQQTGRDLRPFFDAWLLGRKSPPRT